MSPGEHMAGQLQLAVRLAVGSQRTAFPTGPGLIKGSMISFRHGMMTCFTSRCLQHHSEHSN